MVRFSAAMCPGHDYVLVGRRAALGISFERLIDEFDSALRRVHAGRNQARRPIGKKPRGSAEAVGEKSLR